jgi:hypothetical protein
MMLVLYQSLSISGSISNIYWHARQWSSISFSHWQCPSDREFSFPRFVGLLMLSLCLKQWFNQIYSYVLERFKSSLERIIGQNFFLKSDINFIRQFFYQTKFYPISKRQFETSEAMRITLCYYIVVTLFIRHLFRVRLPYIIHS